MMDEHPPRTAVPPTPSPTFEEAAASNRLRPSRERALNAPWPVLAGVGLLIAVFLWQLWVGPETAIDRFALVPIELSAGRPMGLLGHIFLHGGWSHLSMNAFLLLAFGAPVARLYGASPSGALRFAAFFLLCGVVGGLTFSALQPTGITPALGASGAASGLVGGAARLIERQGVLGSPFSRAALGLVVPLVVLNLLIAAARVPLGPAVPIAWEAHLGGLAAGLLLVGVFAPRRRPG